jgi:hypothetical protein
VPAYDAGDVYFPAEAEKRRSVTLTGTHLGIQLPHESEDSD